MQLSTDVTPGNLARVQFQTGIVLVAGRVFEIGTSPEKGNIFNAEVPTDKEWKINLTLSIEETDA